MFGKSIRLFRLFGFEVKIDYSWFVVAVLITWTLARGLFPQFHPNLESSAYWWMGMAGTLGLFVSIVIHELAHSLVARRYGIPMRGITLFIFGGVAEMSQEPPSAKSEFTMAIAGPIMSVMLGSAFFVCRVFAENARWPVEISGVAGYLSYLNLLLAGFNMIPAFPLDGGRVLRSGLWAWRGNVRWATRISSAIGSGFGLLLIAFGIFTFISGNFISGMWWALIGMFLRSASQLSYQQLVVRDVLKGEPVERFMRRNPVSVPPDLPVDQLVEDYVYNYHSKIFPVVEDGNIRGCVSTRQIRAIPPEEWKDHKVEEITLDCSNDNTIDAEDDALKALATMKESGNNRLLVVRDHHLVGVVTQRDLMEVLSSKLDVEKDLVTS